MYSSLYYLWLESSASSPSYVAWLSPRRPGPNIMERCIYADNIYLLVKKRLQKTKQTQLGYLMSVKNWLSSLGSPKLVRSVMLQFGRFTKLQVSTLDDLGCFFSLQFGPAVSQNSNLNCDSRRDFNCFDLHISTVGLAIL